MSSNTTEWEDLKMVEEYFARSDHYREKLGQNTIVLFQSGTFYEVYGYKGSNDSQIQGSLIEDFSQVCDMQISEKKMTYQNKSVYMAGFGARDWQLEKYKNRLLENNYTVVVIIQLDEMQESGAKKKKRELEGIYSPGTYVPPDTRTQLSNHMMCIWTETYETKGKTQHILGISILNVVTHQSYLLEYTIGDRKLQATSFDDLERCLTIYTPKEIILISQTENLESIVPSLQNIYIHRYDDSMKIIQNAEKQVYTRHVISQYFGIEALNQCAEFTTYTLATQSFCVLMHFLEEHNPQLCKRVKLPLWENQTQTTVLANHTLTQLNILSQSSAMKSSLQSVHNWTNKCITCMGRREWTHQLTHPTFDMKWLNREYETMDQWMGPHSAMMESLRKTLHNTSDMSSHIWSLMTQKLNPSLFFKMHKTLSITHQIWTCMADMSWMHLYCEHSYEPTVKRLEKCLRFIEKRMILENCEMQVQMNHYEVPILKPGLFPALDELHEKHKKQQAQLDAIWMFIEKQMSPTAKKGEFVKYNQTEKNGISLQMTKLRSESLQKKMASSPYKTGAIQLDHGITFEWKDVSFRVSGKNNMEICLPVCNQLCKALGEFRSEVDALTHLLYLDILREMEKEFMPVLDTCGQILEKVDVLWMKCTLSMQYHYHRPTIDSEASKSYVDAKGMRHILIERLLQDELYVPNDICLGKGEPDGVLLFGTNAVGKTSLMRALGICVILAQAGMYVPCQQFNYHPYKAIYSRILNQDNLFKGLSTFAVEMSELRVIHQYADEYSLILGDELCSGTETTSALCIVMASLMRLHERKCSFLLATHFHEIMEYPELKELTRIRCCHMAVSYDEGEDCLVYSRILQDGPGVCNYGLEVCKSLYMDKAFLEEAYTIRKTHFPEFEGSLSHPQTKYNALKIRGKCEQCGKVLGEETHHMQEQHQADDKGYINDTFHKNHVANLMSLCEQCHLEMHSQDMSPISVDLSSAGVPPRKIVKRRVKTTNGYKIK